MRPLKLLLLASLFVAPTVCAEQNEPGRSGGLAPGLPPDKYAMLPLVSRTFAVRYTAQIRRQLPKYDARTQKVVDALLAWVDQAAETGFIEGAAYFAKDGQVAPSKVPERTLP